QYTDLGFDGVGPEIINDSNEVLRFQILNFNKALIAYMKKEKERRIQRSQRQRESGAAKEGSDLNKAFSVAIQAGYKLKGEEGAKLAFTSIKNTFTMATAINQQKF